MRFATLLASTVFAAAIGTQAALAAQPAGNAVAVLQSANVEGGGGSRVLAVQAPVFSGDVVQTGRSGQAQLLFLDKTRMVVGPSSRLNIDSFVYQGGTTARQFTISAVKGAFRFITGASAKQAYVIKTPTATIGVRGTRFDFTVNGDGTTNLALYEGGVSLCDRATPRRHCTLLTGSCSVIVLSPQKDFRWIRDINERKNLLNRKFPYAFRQEGLRADFRVRSGGCNISYSNEPPHSSGGAGAPIAPSAPPAAPPPAPPPATPPATPPPSTTPPVSTPPTASGVNTDGPG